jgi:hypothetical protein
MLPVNVLLSGGSHQKPCGNRSRPRKYRGDASPSRSYMHETAASPTSLSESLVVARVNLDRLLGYVIVPSEPSRPIRSTELHALRITAYFQSCEDPESSSTQR